ncbi:MAG: 3-hydroxy-3-methylglutaryl-CoA reductase [Spirochaetales bacterium]|nr:3-hydroxy-3-methylglutaryl-CoA reductase [Spirochaetales bacterium]
MNTIQTITERYEQGLIKEQALEATVYEHIYHSKPEHFLDACKTASIIRCEVVEKRTGVSLALIKSSHINNATFAHGRLLTGIEKKIGGALIPMGVAGPVNVKGEYAEGEYYIPLATNEAALVAGVQRGMKAINLAGGIHTIVTYDGMTRAPLIEAPDISSARKLCERVVKDSNLLNVLRAQVKDPFVRLERIVPYQLGTKVFLRIECATGDAMGMNGVTKASADIVRKLLEELPGWKLITISSNLCTDKKAAHINVLQGRGKSVHAEVLVPKDVLTKVFKQGATARQIEKVVFHKCYLGSSLSGTLTGFNVNAANALAAVFAATGQDLAHVVSSSATFVQAEAIGDDLHFQVTMPGLEVATIGGGTAFGTAQEALALMGCKGFGTDIYDNVHVKRLAELCCVAVASLDLNTACAQAAGYEMADSHVALARGEVDS